MSLNKITKRLILAGIGACALLSPVAQASFCASLQEIQRQNRRGCMDNRAFLDQAELCLEKLERSAKQKGAALAKVLEKGTDAGQSAQFLEAMNDHSQAEKSLIELEALSRQATLEVRAYLLNLFLPEDVGSPIFADLTDEQVANLHPCFGETKESLEDVAQDFEYYTQKFQAALASVRSKGQTAGNRAANLSQTGNAKPLPSGSGARGKVVSPAPKGPNWRPSDVSGTEKIKPRNP